MAGFLGHLSVRRSAMPAWKAAIGAAPRGEYRDEFRPAPYPHVADVAESLARANAGRTLAWCDRERPHLSLRAQVLASTPVLPVDLAALRREAVLTRCKTPGQRIVYGFCTT